MTNKELKETVLKLISHCMSNNIASIGGELQVGDCRIEIYFDYECVCGKEECDAQEKL